MPASGLNLILIFFFCWAGSEKIGMRRGTRRWILATSAAAAAAATLPLFLFFFFSVCAYLHRCQTTHITIHVCDDVTQMCDDVTGG